MLERITVRGGAATVLWGYRPAVTLRSWTIVKQDGAWTLKGVLERVDAFQARQRPLLFTAPRDGGFWLWPVVELHVGTSQVVATLGPPEQ